MMKRVFIFTIYSFLVSGFAGEMPELYFDPPPREIKIDASQTWALVSKGQSDVELVAPSEAGDTAKYAGEELQRFLQQSLGVSIPLLEKRGNAKYAIILGSNALFRKAFPELEVGALTLDGFYMKQKGNELYITGRDEMTSKIRQFLKSRSGDWQNECYFERGTLFGVYDFLERFAGVRFYFDGEIGTVVPKHSELKIPASIDIMDRPDYTNRNVSWLVLNQKEWYNDEDSVQGSNRNYLRWRLQSRSIPNCHGLAYFGYCERFAETHPEYFALREDGKRYLEPEMQHTGQLCLTNEGIRNEIFLDASSALKGEPASVRGVVLPHYKTSMWASPAYQHGFINIMPQDGFYWCRCQECRKYFDRGDKAGSELIWGMTAEIADRVKAANIPGYLTQMAYHFYSIVPDVEIPDNVLVMVATAGPWREDKPTQEPDDSKIRDWTKKTGRKVWLWNYCLNNAQWGDNYGIPGMPHTTPRTIGNYYKRLKPYLSGAFMECETDHFIWGVPNIYVASKIFWNVDSNVEAILDDFYGKMFGKGAPEIERFFDIIEKTWLKNRQEVDTPLGPQLVHLSQFQVWSKIYSPERLRELTMLFDQARNNAAGDDEAIKRIAFFREKFIEVMQQYLTKFHTFQNNAAEITLPVNSNITAPALDRDFKISEATAYLRPLKDVPCDISIKTVVWRNGQNLCITFRCNEPEMNQLKIGKHSPGSMDIFNDALFEVFLNPSGDYKNYYQIAIHPSGNYQTIAYPSRKVWNAGISVRTHIDENFWSGEITIPLASLQGMNTQGFPFNLSYNRQFQTEAMYSKLYTWSPYIKTSFHEIGKFGNLMCEGKENENLVKDWSFEVNMSGDNLGAWRIVYPPEENFEGVLESDSRIFFSGGQSLHMRMDNGKRVDAVQQVKLKPATTYVFSYYIRHRAELNSVVNALVYAGKNIFMPELPIRGNAEWHKKEFTFTTSEQFDGNSHIRFCISTPKAEIWIDNVRLVEKK